MTPALRQVRSLDAEQWQRVVDALWVLRTVPYEEGLLRYGRTPRWTSPLTLAAPTQRSCT